MNENKWMKEWINGWMDEWMNELINLLINDWKEKQEIKLKNLKKLFTLFSSPTIGVFSHVTMITCSARKAL